MRTIGIVVVPPWREAEHLEALPKFCTEAGISDLGYMIQCHPESSPLMQKIEESVERFAKARDRVRPLGIKPGVLLQTTVNHGERHHPLSDVGFQRIVGEDGAVCEACFCPADEGFFDYMAEVATSLSRAEPDFLLVDDDFRLSHHPPAMFGCFCEKHLSLFGNEFGEPLGREELVALVAQDSERGTRARTAWLTVRRSTYVDFFRRFRAAIDAVDPKINCGFCNVKWNSDLTEEAARILAGRNVPFARLNAGIYLNSSPARFAQAMVQTATIRASLSLEIECLSEADTCPHTRYSLSAAALSAYITGTLLAGTDGPKLWIANCQEWYLDESDRYRREIGSTQAFYEEVRQMTARTEWLGPRSPQSYGRAPELPWRREDGMWNHVSESPNWAGSLLGRYGMPWQAASGPGVTMIAGDTAAALNDEEILRLFRGPVLLDGSAAVALDKRGYGSSMGVTTETNESLRISYERFADDSGIYGRYAGSSLNISEPRIPRLVPVSDEVRIVSHYVSVPYYQSTDATVIAPAVTLYTNKQGGRVAVFARLPGFGGLGALNDRVKAQLIGVLSWLDGRPLPVWTVNTADTFLRFGRLSEGYLLAIINLNPDSISPLELEMPGVRPKRIERLQRSGSWEAVDFKQTDSRIEIGIDLPIFGAFVARLFE